MVRKSPCQYCKQRRRKCEKSYDSEPCVLCTKMKKKCVPREIINNHSSSNEDEEGIINEKYEDLCRQIEDLQIEMCTLETSLIKQKEATKMTKQEPVWNIRVENGRLILESDIKTLEDFHNYGNSFMRYLSPFGDTFQTTLVFEKQASSLLHKTASTMSQLANCAYQDNTLYAKSYIVKCIDPTIFVEKLIDIYFHCFNNLVPMVHESSYRKYIKTLDNVLEDPVTLAICATSSVHTCPHAFFNSQEKRYFGEYFYSKCIDKLVDIFDEPGRELESLIIINTMQTFMFITLRLNECIKWANIGYIIGLNLTQKYPDYIHGRDIEDNDTRILYASIHRNFIIAHSMMFLINMFSESVYEYFDSNKTPLDVLPDEPFTVKSTIELTNLVIKLETNPVTILIYEQSCVSNHNQTLNLTFEDIIRYEGMVMEWWKALPDYLKISEEPFECTKEIIGKCTDFRKLLMSLYIHGLSINIQSVFFHPKETSDVLHILREKATHMVIYSAVMTLAIVKRFTELDDYCFSPAKLLLRSIDALISLTQLGNNEINHKTKTKIEEFVHEFKKSFSPDHQGFSTSSSAPIILYENYKHFPLPFEAVFLDVVLSSVKDISEI
ncbi:unnamed protein product [Rhizopus stolonifer]